MRWKVGSTQPTALRGSGLGHGFSIQNEHGVPLVTLVYLNEAASKRAEMLARQMLDGIAEMVVPSRH